MYAYNCVYIYVCVYAYIYIYLCVCVCIYIYVYTYMYSIHNVNHKILYIGRRCSIQNCGITHVLKWAAPPSTWKLWKKHHKSIARLSKSGEELFKNLPMANGSISRSGLNPKISKMVPANVQQFVGNSRNYILMSSNMIYACVYKYIYIYISDIIRYDQI